MKSAASVRRMTAARRRARLAAATLALVGVGTTGCGDNSTDGTASRDDPAVSELIANAERYHGQELTIEAEVSRQMDHRVWEMANGRLFAIYDRGFTDDPPRPGDRLRLTGTPEPLEKSRIERELRVNIEDHFFRKPFLQDDVAFVADRVERLG